jgi:hypothetical protein
MRKCELSTFNQSNHESNLHSNIEVTIIIAHLASINSTSHNSLTNIATNSKHELTNITTFICTTYYINFSPIIITSNIIIDLREKR